MTPDEIFVKACECFDRCMVAFEAHDMVSHKEAQVEHEGWRQMYMRTVQRQRQH